MNKIFDIISVIISNILELIIVTTNLLIKNPFFIIIISIPILSIIFSLIYSILVLDRKNKVKVKFEGKTYWINKGNDEMEDIIGVYKNNEVDEYNKYTMDDEDFDLTSEQLWNKYHGYKYK